MRALVLLRNVLPLLLLGVFPASQAQAGLFDFLDPPQPQLAIERPAPSDLPPVTQPRHSAEVHRHIVVVHKAAKPVDLRGKSAALQDDGTLRAGDAIMTAHGIRVFAGASQGEHGASEFATLAETKGLTPAEQTTLAEIDAHRSDEAGPSKVASADQLVSGRSAADTSMAWKWLKDPKGRLVRYVGP